MVALSGGSHEQCLPLVWLHPRATVTETHLVLSSQLSQEKGRSTGLLPEDSWRKLRFQIPPHLTLVLACSWPSVPRPQQLKGKGSCCGHSTASFPRGRRWCRPLSRPAPGKPEFKEETKPKATLLGLWWGTLPNLISMSLSWMFTQPKLGLKGRHLFAPDPL